MATHFWLFPWFALLAGVAACVLGWIGGRTAHAGPSPTFSRPLLILWAFVVVGVMLAGLKLGVASGFDFIAARGLLLGALGGLLLVWLVRRAPSDSLPPLLLGLGTALIAAGRLWLTHAEISGLAAVALGAALSVLCLAVAPTLLSSSKDVASGTGARVSTLGLLYPLTLAATVALGFIRAHTLGDMFWADIPLLLGAGLSLGASVGSGLIRRTPTILARLLPPLIGALLVLIPLSFVTHIGRLAGLLVLGALLFALLGRLSSRRAPSEETPGGFSETLGPLIGGVMIAAGATLAFALSSGYGLGLFVLGGWLVSGLFFADLTSDDAASVSPRLSAVSALGFTALLLIYRLGVLQNNPAVRASGPGDTWDLFAVSLGALLPLLAAEWARLDGLASRLASWAVVLQWVLSLALPAIILDYIWQPRSVSGLLLGTALGQLLAGLNAEARQRLAPLTVSGVVLSLVLFEFLPALGHVDTPTRTVRLGLVILGAILLLLRLFVPGRKDVPRLAGGETTRTEVRG